MIKVTKEHLNTPKVSYCRAQSPQFIFHNGSDIYLSHFVEFDNGAISSSTAKDAKTLSEFLKERD